MKLTDLGINVIELETELHARLTTTHVVANADDQLLGEAFKLQPGEY